MSSVTTSSEDETSADSVDESSSESDYSESPMTNPSDDSVSSSTMARKPSRIAVVHVDDSRADSSTVDLTARSALNKPNKEKLDLSGHSSDDETEDDDDDDDGDDNGDEDKDSGSEEESDDSSGIYPTIQFNDAAANARQNNPVKFKKNIYTTTKYTALTFFPRQLYEQFRRVANIYFLLVAIITLIPAASSLNPFSSIFPLVFVVGVAMVKEGYEDYKRWREDEKENNRKFDVYDPVSKAIVVKKSKDIHTGDIIRVSRKGAFPADLVCISSSSTGGRCYIETSSLDGETALKSRQSISVTAEFDVNELCNIKGTLKAEAPRALLSKFKATTNITVGSNDEQHDISLDASNLLMRGCSLRNTDWIYGIVVYPGKHTKLMCNASSPPSKRSQVDRFLDKIALAVFIFKLLMLLIVSIAGGLFQGREVRDSPHLAGGEDPAIEGILVFLRYFAIFSYFIPISLFVTVELAKLFQAIWMVWDTEMTTEGLGCTPKNSNLNDELIRTQYIFSDKTGTLTRNEMKFDKCSIKGVVYTKGLKGQLGNIVEDKKRGHKDVNDFILNLVLNHSVVLSEYTDEATQEKTVEYSGESPDEIALVEASEINGYVFKGRNNNTLTISIGGVDQEFELLNLAKFSSKRARMTVVIRHPDGKIMVYSKGADSVMMKLLKQKDGKLVQVTQNHLDMFSSNGLRTLLLCQKSWTEAEYQAYIKQYKDASLLLEGREKAKKQAWKLLEKDFELVGATAIEDKLQDKVAETLHFFLEAGVKVWMITGDKEETAINIGTSCKLLPSGLALCRVTKCKKESDVQDKLKEGLKQAKKLGEIALIIDGDAMVFALAKYRDEFRDLGLRSKSVICCRASPKQKANVVKMIRKGAKGTITLAVGDGANDVAMIQQAHIGVGIFGKEGTQSARASDYAIREFKHLVPLVMKHGRYSLLRNAGLIQYSFYKNLSVFLAQLYFAWFSGFSGQTLYEDWIIAGYNVILTSLSPFLYALFEQDIKPKVIYKYPEASREYRAGILNWRTFSVWIITIIVHSWVLFGSFLIYFGGIGSLQENGQADNGLYVVGVYVITAGLAMVHTKMFLITRHWTWPVWLGLALSIVIYVIMLWVENDFTYLVPSLLMVTLRSFTAGSFYFYIVWVPTATAVIDLCFMYVQRQYFPADWQILQEADRLGVGRNKPLIELGELNLTQTASDDSNSETSMNHTTEKEKLLEESEGTPSNL